jgi:hypothetical protein
MEDWKANSGVTSKSTAEKPTPLVIPGTPSFGPGSGDKSMDTPGTDRKLTRNLKRRYDEINNVQKVRLNLYQCADLFSLFQILRFLLTYLFISDENITRNLGDIVVQFFFYNCIDQKVTDCRESFVDQGVDEMAPIDQTLEKEHEEKTKVKNIQVRCVP